MILCLGIGRVNKIARYFLCKFYDAKNCESIDKKISMWYNSSMDAINEAHVENVCAPGVPGRSIARIGEIT